MSDSFIGEIRAFSFKYAPKNWASCDGQILDINQYQVFYPVIGTTYGGDGRSTFALPDFRGRAPMHFGNSTYWTSNRPIGSKGGYEKVALTEATVPEHRYVVVVGTDNANSEEPKGSYLGQGVKQSGKQTDPWPTYANSTPELEMAPVVIGNTGRSLPHDNRQPYLALKYCIALKGLWPKRPE